MNWWSLCGDQQRADMQSLWAPKKRDGREACGPTTQADGTGDKPGGQAGAVLRMEEREALRCGPTTAHQIRFPLAGHLRPPGPCPTPLHFPPPSPPAGTLYVQCRRPSTRWRMVRRFEGWDMLTAESAHDICARAAVAGQISEPPWAGQSLIQTKRRMDRRTLSHMRAVTGRRWAVADGGWRVTDGNWRVTDGSWRVTNGGPAVVLGGKTGSYRSALTMGDEKHRAVH